MNRVINPFYIRNPRPIPAVIQPRPGPQFARLPLAPVNGSPVPHLTSLYHFDRAGNFGSRSYPGN